MSRTTRLAGLVVTALLLTPLAVNHAGHVPKSAKPNVLFILTDDMGWGDLSCFGNKEMATPNIDRLAKQGIRFTQFYVASPICSPSRVSYTTGCFPARWRINDYLHSRAANKAHECATGWTRKRPPWPGPCTGRATPRPISASGTWVAGAMCRTRLGPRSMASTSIT